MVFLLNSFGGGEIAIKINRSKDLMSAYTHSTDKKYNDLSEYCGGSIHRTCNCRAGLQSSTISAESSTTDVRYDTIKVKIIPPRSVRFSVSVIRF